MTNSTQPTAEPPPSPLGPTMRKGDPCWADCRGGYVLVDADADHNVLIAFNGDEYGVVHDARKFKPTFAQDSQQWGWNMSPEDEYGAAYPQIMASAVMQRVTAEIAAWRWRLDQVIQGASPLCEADLRVFCEEFTTACLELEALVPYVRQQLNATHIPGIKPEYDPGPFHAETIERIEGVLRRSGFGEQHTRGTTYERVEKMAASLNLLRTQLGLQRAYQPLVEAHRSDSMLRIVGDALRTARQSDGAIVRSYVGVCARPSSLVSACVEEADCGFTVGTESGSWHICLLTTQVACDELKDVLTHELLHPLAELQDDPWTIPLLIATPTSNAVVLFKATPPVSTET